VTYSKFTISPNPAINEIYLDNLVGESVSFYDLNGKLIIKREFTKTQEIAFLSKGMYYIKVQTAEGIYQSKFIKE
jgi:hypothetical protein